MKLIRDILKEKRAAARQPSIEQIMSEGKAAEAAERASANATSTSDARAPQTGMGMSPTQPSTSPKHQNIFDDLDEVLRAKNDGTRAAGVLDLAGYEDEYEEEYDESDYDADDYDSEEEDESSEEAGAFDSDTFLMRKMAPQAETQPQRPDPFDRLNQTSFGAAGMNYSPSPLKTVRDQLRDAPRPEAGPTPDTAKPVPDAPEADAAMPELTSLDMPELASLDMPAPAAGRGASKSGRVKTRLLGFSQEALEEDDPFAKESSQTDGRFPVGWVAVVSELGRGHVFPLYDGVAKVGRGSNQAVSLNFGDNAISRENHISIAYDSEQNKFFIGHSGKSNLVRLNGKPLLSTEELRNKDMIRLGETTLRFMAFCDEEFSWNVPEEEKVLKHG